MIWISVASAPTPIEAKQGVLDLRDWDFDENEVITLDGEWEFYPNLLLAPNEIANNEKIYVRKPGKWDHSTSIYGTYRLRILVADDQLKQLFQLQLPHKPFVSHVMVNHQLVIDNETGNDNGKNYKNRFVSRIASFTADENNEIEIVIQQPSYAIAQENGLAKSIQFGHEFALKRQYFTSIAMQFLVAMITLLFFMYGCIIYLWRRRHIEYLYFGIAALCAALATVMDDDRLLFAWVAIDYVWSIKLLFLAYTGVSICMLLFVQNLFVEHQHNKIIRLFYIVYVLSAIALVLSTYKYIAIVSLFVFIMIAFSFATMTILMWRNMKKGNPDHLFLLLAAAGATSSFLWAFYKSRSLTELPYYPFDVLIAFLSISILLFKQFFHVSDQNQQLAIKLTQEIKRKDDFLANTSHELRNPLHGIINVAQSVLRNKADHLTEESEKNIELVVTIGRHLSRTLDDLLDVTRLKEHRIHLQKERLDIRSVTSGIVDMLTFMTEKKNIQLVSQIPDHFPEVAADKNRLIQILFNLLHNAVKFSHEGTITITADLHEGMANIHITDQGIGMDQETMNRIFEPYGQGDSGITAMGGGLGLGLSICRQLVELHGGILQVESSVGEGSRFTFSLPLAAENDDQTSSTEEMSIIQTDAPQTVNISADYPSMSDRFQQNMSMYKPKILAVDDDPVNLQVLASILPSEQYELETVTSGQEALARLDAHEWDLVITDVMMPHMSGYELTRAIREKHSISELPVLLITARSQPEDIYAGFQAGANDYVTKPVDALELHMRVHALTDLKDSIRERLRMEAAWLQAQIQPHFLYNTLNSIISLSEIDIDRMAILLETFGYYLRGSFNTKNLASVVPFEQELRLLEAYLYIEKERFGDRLQVVWEVEGADDLYIPPLVLQTLVENAARHGVLQCIEGGTIRICIYPEGDYTTIKVSDDGIGMDEEKVKEVLTSRPDKTRGIGLLNTNQRLKQLYGEGLHIESALDKGTIVSFRVPIKTPISNK